MLPIFVLEDYGFAVKPGVKIPTVVVAFVIFAHHRVELLKIKVAIHNGYIVDTDINEACYFVTACNRFYKVSTYTKDLRNFEKRVTKVTK